MISYEKNIKPIKITARDAHNQSFGNEEYLNALQDVYENIKESISEGYVETDLFYAKFSIADRIFRELLSQGYNLTIEKSDNCWHLSVNWEDVDLDPNKKYILPMEGTDSIHFGDHVREYAIVNSEGSWKVVDAYDDRAAFQLNYVVTAQQLEGAPEWVKAIEAIEVKD